MFKFFKDLLVRPLKGKAAILCFHRVLPNNLIDSEFNPNVLGLCCSNSQFESIISWISLKYKIVSLDELVNHLDSNSKEFLVSITFDDGYKDNLEHALPILEKYNAPATIFITKNFLERNTIIWWFELWEIILERNEIVFQFGNKNFKYSTNSITEKVEAFHSLKQLFLINKIDNHSNILKEIAKSDVRKFYSKLFLSINDLMILDKNPLITIGAHTIDHENLRNLSPIDLYRELSLIKNELEAILKHSVDQFAFPYGSSSEASEREYEMIKVLGYKCGVTLRSPIIGSSNKMALTRIPISYNTNIQMLEYSFNIVSKFYIYFFEFLKYTLNILAFFLNRKIN